MNERRKKKIKSRGAGNHKAPHCLNAHMWTTVDPATSNKNKKEHTHSYEFVQTGRREHMAYTRSLSLYPVHTRPLDDTALKRKTEQQRTGGGKPQARKKGGKTMGSHELSLDQTVATGALCEKQQSTLFSYRQTELENPTLTTSSSVHLATLNPSFQRQPL